MKLESCLSGRWQSATDTGRHLVNPATGDEISRADATGFDLGAGLSAQIFADRGARLRVAADTRQANRDACFDTARINSGNTLSDVSVDIDGSIFAFETYARLGAGLGDATRIAEPGQDRSNREPVFFARHVRTSRRRGAVQINALNCPARAMWEKVAQALLAEVPSLVRAATSTALMAARMVCDVIAASVLPEGALSLLCGKAIAPGVRVRGSLAVSRQSNDPDILPRAFAGLAHWNGRAVMMDEEIGKAHSGHANVMANCVHGGPGRVGGGEELGGFRRLLFIHTQRKAVQAGSAALAALVTGTTEASP